MPVLPNGPFDPSQHEDMRNSTVIPPGDYIGKITKQKLVPTSNKTGTMLVLDISIVAGPYKGATLIQRLNIDNPNQKAMEIAGQELKTICVACGFPTTVNNTDVLNNVAMVINVDVEPASGKYGPKNIPTYYKSAVGLTEPPVNPEPDDNMLAIMRGTAAAPEATPMAPDVPAAPPANFNETSGESATNAQTPVPPPAAAQTIQHEGRTLAAEPPSETPAAPSTAAPPW